MHIWFEYSCFRWSIQLRCTLLCWTWCKTSHNKSSLRFWTVRFLARSSQLIGSLTFAWIIFCVSLAVGACHAKLKAIQLIWSLLDFKFHCSTPAHSYSFSQFHFNHSANVYHKQIVSFRVASAHPSAVASTVIFLLNKIKISLLPSLSDVFLSTWLQALFYTFHIFFFFFILVMSSSYRSKQGKSSHIVPVLNMM